MKLDITLPAAARTSPWRSASAPLSFFEFWPGWLFYAPIVAQWILLGLRYRDFSLPTAANPRIELGGLCGESKVAILDQVAAPARHWLATYTSFVTHSWDAEHDTALAVREMERAGLAYPVVAKPDIGCNGTGVRLIAGSDDLLRYLTAFPRRQRVMLQELLTEEGEAGIFYVRHPGEARGRLTSLTLKYAPFVVGDGRSTLEGLILADSRAGRVPWLYLPRLAYRLHEIPPQGEHVRLVFVGNHCKGSIFQDGTPEISGELTDQIDAIAQALPDFHFGRVDVRFSSLAALKRGEGFRVIEINGVGSEATHIWDPATGLWDAWRAQLFHYAEAFRIGAVNRAQGHRTSGLWVMRRHWRLQRRLMASYPLND
jgi:hypothetical protein